jgi:hypothetical protein
MNAKEALNRLVEHAFHYDGHYTDKDLLLATILQGEADAKELAAIKARGITTAEEAIKIIDGINVEAVKELQGIKERAEEERIKVIEYSQDEGVFDDGKLSINVPNMIDFILNGESK